MSDARRLITRTSRAQGDHHFFSPGAMRFFDSRLLDVVWTGPDTAYFLTSEQPFTDLPRAWQVHVATFWPVPGQGERVVIDDVEGRQPTLDDALAVLRRAISTPLHVTGDMSVHQEEEHRGDL